MPTAVAVAVALADIVSVPGPTAVIVVPTAAPPPGMPGPTISCPTAKEELPVTAVSWLEPEVVFAVARAGPVQVVGGVQARTPVLVGAAALGAFAIVTCGRGLPEPTEVGGGGGGGRSTRTAGGN